MLNFDFTVRHEIPNLLRASERLEMALQNTSSQLVNDAGTQAGFLIANTLNSLKQIAGESIDTIDAQVKENINDIMSVVHAIEERLYDQLTEFSKRLAYPVLKSVFASSKPLLLSIEPSCIIRTSDVGNAIFKLVGHFPDVGRDGFRPSLVMNGHQATLIKPLHDECSFAIPYQSLFSKALDVCVAQVELPYSTTFAFQQDSFRYKLLIGIIPSSPGAIVIEHTKSVVERVINSTPKSGHFHLISRKDLGRNDKNQLCRVQATEGWKVLRGSCQLHVHHNKGDTSLNLVVENETEVSYRAITYYRKSKRACGELRFEIFFSEYQENNVLESPVKIPVSLDWNNSQWLDCPPKTWKVIFTPFDQPFLREFFSPSLDDPFINIISEGQGLRISTKDPTKIKRLQVTAVLPEDFMKEEGEEDSDPAMSSIVNYVAAFALGFGVRHFVAKL